MLKSIFWSPEVKGEAYHVLGVTAFLFVLGLVFSALVIDGESMLLCGILAMGLPTALFLWDLLFVDHRTQIIFVGSFSETFFAARFLMWVLKFVAFIFLTILVGSPYAFYKVVRSVIFLVRKQ